MWSGPGSFKGAVTWGVSFGRARSQGGGRWSQPRCVRSPLQVKQQSPLGRTGDPARRIPITAEKPTAAPVTDPGFHLKGEGGSGLEPPRHCVGTANGYAFTAGTVTFEGGA